MKAKTDPKDSKLLDQLVQYDRPQERLEREGPMNLADHELLAMLLRSGSQKSDVLAMSSGLINEAGSLASLLCWPREDFLAHHGIGKIKALQLSALSEIARRTMLQQAQSIVLKDAKDVVAHMHPIVARLPIEKLWAVCLSKRNHLMRCAEIASGSFDAVFGCTRDIFVQALRHGAVKLFIVHNHPSGDPTASEEDLAATVAFAAAARLLGIELLGHIIIGAAELDPEGIGYREVQDA